MNRENLKEIIQRYSDNYDMVNNEEHDEIFKWKALKQFREVWFSAKAESMPFSELFKEAKSQCSILIDNSHVSPTNGIVKLAEERPKEVERLFREVLLDNDEGNLNKRQENMDRFLEEIEELRQQVFPENWKYKQERHAASCYLFFVNPSENYIYRYSDAEEFAKHMEFGLDIGSGDNFDLGNYYKMCDEIVTELKCSEDLLEKHFALVQKCDEYYFDESLHLLAFDLMYCARCYNLYDGIKYRPKKENIKNYTLEKLREQEQLEAKEKADSITRQIHELKLSLESIAMISLIGVRVNQKQYGEGIVTMQDRNKVKVRFKDCEKVFVISKKFLVRPTFADDEEIIEIFTKYGEIAEEIDKLERQLQLLLR